MPECPSGERTNGADKTRRADQRHYCAYACGG
jgi:hypothetical protein